MFYVEFRSIRCMISCGTCQRVAGALKINSQVTANPESVGSGNVNILIKTSKESLAITPEDIPPRALKHSDSNRGKLETRSTLRLRPSRTCF
jgi:hypothetical protein